MTRKNSLLALVAVVAIAAAAVPHRSSSNSSSAIAADKVIWTMTMGYITTAAEQMPEANYSYRPVPTVRTFGELIAHIAGAQHMFCATAMGDKPSAEDDIEKTTKGKAALVAALKASTDYCQKAYAMNDADATGRAIKMFGMEQNAMWAVLMNTAHDNEHYGNIVTYMRMQSMVPPSSQPRP